MLSRLTHNALSLLTITALTGGALGCANRQNTNVNPPPETVQPTHAEQSQASREVVLQAVTALFVDFDAEAAAPLLADDYIQHNPFVPTGAQAVLGFLPALKESGLTATPHRVLADGDLVLLHSTYEQADLFGAPTLIGFDVFRVEDGKLAEHWDNLQVPPEVTVSGRSMTDGPTAITDLELTDANRALIQEFADTVLIGGQFDKLPEYIISEPGAYHQHNPDIGDGLQGLAAGFQALAESGRGITYTQMHGIVAEGNFVFTMAEGTMGDAPTAYFDLFRIEDGLIVEHWDTIATIPPESEFAHDNGKF